MKLVSRLIRIILLLIIVAGVYWTWQNYAPAPSDIGVKVRMACYISAGVLFAVTFSYPLAGLLLLCFLAPLLNAVPLFITNGHPYPIVLFTAVGFIAGWLAKESVQPFEYKLFQGQKWLFVFAVMLVINAAAGILRYYPPWQWDNPEFLKQIINTKQFIREDAIRYTVFVFANELIGILVISGAYGIIRKYKDINYKIESLVIWFILAGAVCAAGAAIYQVQWSVVVNLYNKFFDKPYPQDSLQFCANQSYYWIRLRRANGTCTDPNALGGYIALCVSLASARIIFGGSWKKVSAWVQRVIACLVFGILFLGVYFSGSRSGLLATGLTVYMLVLSAILYYFNMLLRQFKLRSLMRFITVLLAGIFIVIGSYIFSPVAINSLEKVSITRSSSSLLRRLKRDFRLFKREGSKPLGVFKDNRRLLYWKYAKIICRDFPFTGIGLGAYVIELPNYAFVHKERLYRTDNACNYYLNYAAEMGLLAIFALGIFFIILYLRFFPGKHFYEKLNVSQAHLRITYAVVLAVYLIVLIFGVHTLSNEVMVVFSVFLALIAANHEAVLPPKQKQNKLFNFSVWVFIVILLCLYAWRTLENSRTGLNTARRCAAYGLKDEKGWYKWESWENVPFKVRWMGKTATSTVKRDNLLLGVPVMSTDTEISSNNPINVSFYVNGLKVRNHKIEKPGEWSLIKFFVPYANPFIKNINPHVTIRIEADRTWIPKEAPEKDTRELSLLTGEFRWLDPEEENGGWHKREKWKNERPFSWGGIHAYRTVVVQSNRYMKIPMYASNLLLKKFPLDVAVYFNSKYLDTITFRDKHWKNYRYPLPKGCKPGSTNIIEFIAERTWVPKHYGFEDTRSLGVAVGDITLE